MVVSIDTTSASLPVMFNVELGVWHDESLTSAQVEEFKNDRDKLLVKKEFTITSNDLRKKVAAGVWEPLGHDPVALPDSSFPTWSGFAELPGLEPGSVFFFRTARCQFLHRDIVWKSGNNIQAKKNGQKFCSHLHGAIFTLFFSLSVLPHHDGQQQSRTHESGAP